jgi:hypothetical protein
LKLHQLNSPVFLTSLVTWFILILFSTKRVSYAQISEGVFEIEVWLGFLWRDPQKSNKKHVFFAFNEVWFVL